MFKVNLRGSHYQALLDTTLIDEGTPLHTIGFLIFYGYLRHAAIRLSTLVRNCDLERGKGNTIYMIMETIN